MKGFVQSSGRTRRSQEQRRFQVWPWPLRLESGPQRKGSEAHKTMLMTPRTRKRRGDHQRDNPGLQPRLAGPHRWMVIWWKTDTTTPSSRFWGWWRLCKLFLPVPHCGQSENYGMSFSHSWTPRFCVTGTVWVICACQHWCCLKAELGAQYCRWMDRQVDVTCVSPFHRIPCCLELLTDFFFLFPAASMFSGARHPQQCASPESHDVMTKVKRTDFV